MHYINSNFNFIKLFLLICSSLISAKVIMEDKNPGKGMHYNPASHHISKRDADQQHQSPWLNTDWNELGKRRIKKAKSRLENKKMAKNVILFVGDGMGISTVSAGRILKAQKNNLKGEDIYLTWENFPYTGLSRTYTVDRITADSAATATAYLSGVKTNFLTLGVNDEVEAGNCSNIDGNEVDSILHKSIDAGKWTGIVTTTTITHASPAGCYASTALRIWESSVPDGLYSKDCKDIAYQLIHSERNKDIRVMFGGGLINFLPNNTQDPITNQTGKRSDDRNLVEEWLKMKKSKNQKAVLIRNRNEFDSFDPESEDYVLGLLASSHMEFETTRDPVTEPSLAEMTQKSIEVLRRSPNGFFLFVEGGRIDHGHHGNNAFRALHDLLALEEAVSRAEVLTDPEETLIIVTADHSHVFTIGGYASFQEPIFGFASSIQPALDEKPYTQLLYANGPGYLYHKMEANDNETMMDVPRKNITNSSEVSDMNFLQDAAIPTKKETHGGEDVAVYAKGPWSHLFQGTEEQTHVAHVMMFASCVGQYSHEDHCMSPATACHPKIFFIMLLTCINKML